MKKFSFLLSTLGGALAGYVFSNDTLREQLVRAKSPEDAARTLGKHLEKDGKRLGEHVKKFLHSKEVQRHVRKAKVFVEEKVDAAKKGVGAFVGEEKKQAHKVLRRAVKKVKKISGTPWQKEEV